LTDDFDVTSLTPDLYYDKLEAVKDNLERVKNYPINEELHLQNLSTRIMILSFTTMVKKYNMDVKGIIHIGAHRGQEIEEYIDNGVQDIIMFEACASLNFNILEKRMQDMNANITAYQVALGNEEKNVTMYLSDNDLISGSVLRPKVHLQLHPGVGFPGTEEVEMKRLDSFAEETQNFNFINMDVQGYET
jgi:FkbM family methyltransferase